MRPELALRRVREGEEEERHGERDEEETEFHV
jgi:hypothetical protein